MIISGLRHHLYVHTYIYTYIKMYYIHVAAYINAHTERHRPSGKWGSLGDLTAMLYTLLQCTLPAV